MRSGVLALVAAMLLAAAAVPLATSDAGAYSAGPILKVAPDLALPGRTVRVVGSNFPGSTNVQAQICGDRALGGSVDCDLSSSQEVAVTPTGQFDITLSVTIPPKPCPCVVMAVDASLTITPTTPFTVIGAPVSTPTRFGIRPLRVRSANLEGDGPWTSWFGASPQRTLVVTVFNPNRTSYVNPPLVLTVGSNAATSTKEATSVPLASLGPLQTRTYRVPVSFPAFSIGEYQVHGLLGSAGMTTHFSVSTWLIPWGLLVLLLIVLEIILLAITRAVRERRRRNAPPPTEGPIGNGSTPHGDPFAALVAASVVGSALDEDGLDPTDPLNQLE